MSNRVGTWGGDLVLRTERENKNPHFLDLSFSPSGFLFLYTERVETQGEGWVREGRSG